MALGIRTLKMMLDVVIFFPDILHWKRNIGTGIGLSKFHEDSLIFEGKTTNLQIEHSSNYFINAGPRYLDPFWMLHCLIAKRSFTGGQSHNRAIIIVICLWVSLGLHWWPQKSVTGLANYPPTSLRSINRKYLPDPSSTQGLPQKLQRQNRHITWASGLQHSKSMEGLIR
jgi:hypothetical protein